MVLKLTQGAFLSVSYIYKWYLLYGKLKQTFKKYL